MSKQIVDDGKREYRRIQKRNQEQPGRAQPAGERNNLLLPTIQIQRQSLLRPFVIFRLQDCNLFPSHE